MAQRAFTCAACGADGLSGQRGRVPTKCRQCASARKAPDPPPRDCDECGSRFTPNVRRPDQRFCRRLCRERHHTRNKMVGRSDKPCAFCEATAAMFPHQKYCSRRCLELASRVDRMIGTQVFTCGDCGDQFSRPAARGQRPKWCPSCRSKRRQINVPKRVRLAVYERDGWICQLCFEPVDRDAAPRSNWAPSIDHIVCRSVAVDDSPDNLRLAHHWCNSVRSDDRSYTAEDLAA